MIIPNQNIKQLITALVVIVSLFLVNQAIMAWTSPSGTPPADNASAPVNVSATSQTKSGSLVSSADMRAPIFYDQDNTNYYTNPASNSWLYRLYSYDIRSSIFYDNDNTGYYIDPAGTSILKDVQVNGALYGLGSQVVAAKGWCASLAIAGAKNYAYVINAPGEISCSTICVNVGHVGCLGSIDFNHGCSFAASNCTLFTGAAMSPGGSCGSTYSSRDYCCCYQ